MSHLWPFCSHLGPSWGPLRAPLGRLGYLLGCLGALGPSWGPLGPSWGPLGPSWGRLGGILCLLRAVLGASSAVVERREAEKAKTLKSVNQLRKLCVFCPSGPYWDASLSSQGDSWGPLGLSVGCLGPILSRLGLIWVVLGDSSGAPKWGRLVALWGRLKPSWRRSRPPPPHALEIWPNHCSMYTGTPCINAAISASRCKQIQNLGALSSLNMKRKYRMQ